ncbi:MAG: glycosyltransferase, partial [Rhodothermia bacterium]|nr:glycosyltransferase [Rhodothermia bacterium]
MISPRAHREKRHVLVLSYYFPPMGLSGVQRVSKFVKYLPEHGWDVTVLTSEPRGYFAFDESLEVEIPSTVRVIRTASADPTRVFRSKVTVNLPAEGLRRSLSKASQWIFIPDNKIGWFPSAARGAHRIHRDRPVDVVLSSAPPYTSHLVGRSIASRAGVPLVLDFRDDWLGNPRHEYPSRIHYALQRSLESKVIAAADAVTTINPKIAGDIRDRHVNRPDAPSITVIPQGYDPEDFGGRNEAEEKGSMSFLYSGIFYDAQSP